MAYLTLTPEKIAQFLSLLAECGNVTRAADEAGLSRVYLYQMRRDDEAFAAEWETAADIGAKRLEDEELELIKSSDYFKAQACEHFKKLGKKSFSVTRSNAVNALDDAETVLNETEVKLDFIFFDMPGTIKSEGVMKTLSQMDYIFVPVSADRFVVESAMSFMQLFHDNFLTQGWSVTKKLAFFWTMVDKRERTSLYDVYEGMFKSLDYSVLNTRLPDSKRFRRELSENRKAVFRSTIFPSDPNLLRGSGIKELSDEICEIIKT
jgi:cellulose biosynthesis protein BcsQ